MLIKLKTCTCVRMPNIADALPPLSCTALMDNPAALESYSAAIKSEVDATVFFRLQAVVADRCSESQTSSSHLAPDPLLRCSEAADSSGLHAGQKVAVALV